MAKVLIRPDLSNRVYVYRDRFDAGHVLAEMLKPLYQGVPNTWVLAIPAGGVPVGLVVAQELGLPFDVIIVRKIHFPDNPEAGFGAISFDGQVLLNEELIDYAGLTEEVIAQQIAKEKKDLEERNRLFRGNRPFPELEGKMVILVDDGLASGFTMMAAVKTVSSRGAQSIIVAVPTASEKAISKLSPLIDEIYCPNVRGGAFFAVADAYQHWYDLSQEEVLDLLKKAGLSD